MCYLQTRWGMMGNSSALGSGIPAPSGISSPSSDSCRQNRRWPQVGLSSRCINNLEERKKPQGAARALEKASVWQCSWNTSVGEDTGCEGLGVREHLPQCLAWTLLIPEGWSCLARGRWSSGATGRLQSHLDLRGKCAGVGILVPPNLE